MAEIGGRSSDLRVEQNWMLVSSEALPTQQAKQPYPAIFNQLKT